MSEKPCAFCALIWQIYEEAKKKGGPRRVRLLEVADLDLPRSREYIRRHVMIAHNVILKEAQIQA